MDLDAYSAAHADEWDRLDALARRRRFAGRDADELIDHYQAAATHLSAISTTAGDVPQRERLSVALSRARLRFTGAQAEPLAQLARYATREVPAALYRIRYLTLVIAVVFAIVATLYAVWIGSNPAVIASLGDYETLRRYAEQDFVNYYSESS